MFCNLYFHNPVTSHSIPQVVDYHFFLLILIINQLLHYRSSRPEVSCKKGILRNLTKFTGKHLCQSLFFNKVAGLNFIKKETLAQVFSSQFRKISKNTFYYRTPLVAASDITKLEIHQCHNGAVTATKISSVFKIFRFS